MSDNNELDMGEMDGGADFFGGFNETPKDLFAGGAKKIKEGYDSYGLYDPSTNKTKGRYISKTPSSAAKKAARRLFKSGSKSARELTVYVRKTTRGCKREIYRYKAVLEVLRTPLVINKDGTQIQVNNKIKVISEDLPANVSAIMNAKKEMEKEKMMKKKEAVKAKRAKLAEKKHKTKKSTRKPKKSIRKPKKSTRKSKKTTGGSSCGYGSCNFYV